METSPLLSSPDAGPLVRHKLEARDVKLPSLITDQSTMLAFFEAPVKVIERLMPMPDFEVTHVMPGTTMVGIACMEYRNVQGLDPYNEVGIMIPMRYRPRIKRVPLLPLVAPKLFRNAGNYFQRMPVTSPDAFDIGVKMHGLRKILADIQFDETARTRRCEVSVDGVPLLQLEVKKTRKLKFQEMTTQTYTVLHGDVLRTPVPTRGKMGNVMGPDSATLTLGTHEVADELREMRLAPKPRLGMYAPHIESILAAPAQTL